MVVPAERGVLQEQEHDKGRVERKALAEEVEGATESLAGSKRRRDRKAPCVAMAVNTDASVDRAMGSFVLGRKQTRKPLSRSSVPLDKAAKAGFLERVAAMGAGLVLEEVEKDGFAEVWSSRSQTRDQKMAFMRQRVIEEVIDSETK